MLSSLVDVVTVEVVASEKLRCGTGIGRGDGGGFASAGEELVGELLGREWVGDA